MTDLSLRVSMHLQLWGPFESPARFLDMAHVLASQDIGPSHAGHTSEKDLVDAFRTTCVGGSGPLDLYAPDCRGRRILSDLLPVLLAEGLSVRARFWNEIPAGYRYASDSALSTVYLATPGHPEPRMFEMQGDQILLSLDRFGEALSSGNPHAFLDEVRLLLKGPDEILTISPRMEEWLEIDPPVRPSP